MKKNFPLEFIYQLFSLLVVFIIVHALFITIIRPTAAQHIEAQRVQLAADPQHQTDDSFYIIVQGYETGNLHYPDALGPLHPCL